MAKKIVLKDDIKQQYTKFFRLSLDYRFMSGGIALILSSVSDAFRRSGGQTTIISTCRMQAKSLLGISSTLSAGADLLKLSMDTMQNLDAAIRQEVNNADMPIVYGLSYGDAASDARVVTQEEYYLISAFESGEQLPYDPNTGKDLGWCAGYAYARFNYLYPNCLPNPPGDAENWLYSCDNQPNLEVVWGDASASTLKNLKTPCAAIIQNGRYGHVLIIEGVTFHEDGTIKEVYWSESNGQYDPVKHPDGYDTSSYYFTEGYDGVMNKYSFDSGEQIPWVLSEIDGFVCYKG